MTTIEGLLNKLLVNATLWSLQNHAIVTFTLETFLASHTLNSHTPHATVILLLGPEPTDVQTHVSQQQEIRVRQPPCHKRQKGSPPMPIKSGMVMHHSRSKWWNTTYQGKRTGQPYAPTWMYLINME